MVDLYSFADGVNELENFLSRISNMAFSPSSLCPMDSPIDSPSSICNILFTVRNGYITMYTVQPLNWFVCSLFEGSLYLEDRAR